MKRIPTTDFGLPRRAQARLRMIQHYEEVTRNVITADHEEVYRRAGSLTARILQGAPSPPS